MKKITSCLLILSCLGVLIRGYSQDKTNPRADTLLEKWIAKSCYGYLKGAQNYNMVVNCFEIAGAGIMGVGLGTHKDWFTAAGFLLGFGGMEMSKSIPVPLTKARRDLDLLQTSWKDTSEYNRIYHQMKTAESLGYATMALTFAGQILLGLQALDVIGVSPSLRYAMFVTGIVCTAVSFGTSVGATLITRSVKIGLRKHYGSFALGMGPQGIGAVYSLP